MNDPVDPQLFHQLVLSRVRLRFPISEDEMRAAARRVVRFMRRRGRKAGKRETIELMFFDTRLARLSPYERRQIRHRLIDCRQPKKAKAVSDANVRQIAMRRQGIDEARLQAEAGVTWSESGEWRSGDWVEG